MLRSCQRISRVIFFFVLLSSILFFALSKCSLETVFVLLRECDGFMSQCAAGDTPQKTYEWLKMKWQHLSHRELLIILCNCIYGAADIKHTHTHISIVPCALAYSIQRSDYENSSYVVAIRVTHSCCDITTNSHT